MKTILDKKMIIYRYMKCLVNIVKKNICDSVSLLIIDDTKYNFVALKYGINANAQDIFILLIELFITNCFKYFLDLKIP